MIELYILKQFVIFADTGTLSKAAELLHLSQPALSRNMKKLETDLEISLFDRTKNHMTLNKNGIYVLSLARKLLEDADAFTTKARDYDRKSRTIFLGVCAPAPMWILTPLITDVYPHMSLQTQMDTTDRLLFGLYNDQYQIIVLPAKPDEDLYFSKICGKETLMFALPKEHPQADRETLSFADMNGENMLLMPDIGSWDFVRNKIPDSRFLTQSDRFSFNELVQASSLPSFVTDLSEKYRETPPGRIYVPISDDEATVTYYLICRQEKKADFKALLHML